MESNKILGADVLDIIFEQKNQLYGAYELRKNYHKRARKAITIVATFAFLISSIPLIAGLFMDEERAIGLKKPPIIFNPDIPVMPPPPVKPPVVPPPTTHQPIASNIFTIPVVIAADSVPDDKILEDQKTLSKENFGATKTEGPEDGQQTLNPGTETGKVNDVIVEAPVVKEVIHETGDLQQFPEFPGGEDAMLAFLKSHIKYPARAQQEGETGKVVLEFVVDKTGKITEIDFLKKAGYGFDDEAKRVMGIMPDWKPGKINGQAVNAKYQLPIIFELEN